jgi:uncharacterized protein YndB with AHSA1/START domain
MARTRPDSTISLTITRTFPAPRERVFHAWTEPQALLTWWSGGPELAPALAEVDLRVGGRYRLGMRAPDGVSIYVCTGVFREIHPPARLVYTWAWEGTPEPETVVTVEFRKQGEGTEVTLVHEGFEGVDVRHRHLQGWEGCLESLARALETGS